MKKQRKNNRFGESSISDLSRPLRPSKQGHSVVLTMQTTLSECREPGEGRRERLGASGKGKRSAAVAAVGCCRGEFNAAAGDEKSAPARSEERAIFACCCCTLGFEERRIWPLKRARTESEHESTAARQGGRERGRRGAREEAKKKMREAKWSVDKASVFFSPLHFFFPLHSSKSFLFLACFNTRNNARLISSSLLDPLPPPNLPKEEKKEAREPLQRACWREEAKQKKRRQSKEQSKPFFFI